MFNFMKKIPGGMLLVPMLLSAIVNTFWPDLFRIGGLSEALFTSDGLNYVVAATCFFSGAGLDIQRLVKVLKKQGVLLLVKTIICIAAGIFYINYFGVEGIWGISAMAFIAVICSTNPSLYLALEEDFGTKDDEGAFGLVGLFSVPAYPMFVYGISQGGSIDWMPIISTLVPIALGMLIGNLDKNMAKFLVPGVSLMMPLMGWSFGTSINLIDAVFAGPQGIALTIIYYLLMIPLLIFTERFFLHEDGMTTLALSTVAGMSVSVPALIAASDPALQSLVTAASAQITLAVVLTSIITPIIAKKWNKEVSHINTTDATMKRSNEISK